MRKVIGKGIARYVAVLFMAASIGAVMIDTSVATERNEQITAAEASAAAEEVIELENNKIAVTSQAFVDDPVNHLPEESYEYGGQVFELEQYKVIDAVLQERIEKISETIEYKEVEQFDNIPGTCEIEAKDKTTGQVITSGASLAGYEYSRYRWSNDFEFKVTVEDANADFYSLGDSLVPAKEKAPFDGYERQLLELIHVNPDYYRIDSVEWITEPWLGKDNKVYREALAKGAKQVADVKAQYAGNVTFPETQAKAVQAFYSLQSQEQAEIVPDELPEEPPEKKRGIWDYIKELLAKILDFIRNHPVLCLSIGLLIIIFMVILILHKLSKKQKEMEKK